MARRAMVKVERSHTTKRCATVSAAQAEAAWYERVPWAAPRLLAVDGNDLIMETLPTAYTLRLWHPAAELAELLTALHAQGIHHRDVHVKNVVCAADGRPLLIDWETALEMPSDVSYDLHGPDSSGVPVPLIHAGLTPQWWGSPQPMSIRSQWGCDVPAQARQRT